MGHLAYHAALFGVTLRHELKHANSAHATAECSNTDPLHEDVGMPPKHARREYTRRDFLLGALATGTLAAVGTYFTPGGSTPRSVNISFVTAGESGGAQDLLISMWNQANPRATVIKTEVPGESTIDVRNAMISDVLAGTADVLNLDVINVPFFQSNQYIVPVELENVQTFLSNTLLPSQLGRPDSPQYWAAPYTTDVGMLYERLKPNAPVSLDGSGPQLSTLVDSLVPNQSGQFAAQLDPDGGQSASEALVCNVLEHALSRDPNILDPNTGAPSLALERWQQALAPLRSAIANGKIRATDTEDATDKAFREQRLSYMRNWPDHYRDLQQDGDPDSRSSRIRVSPLPTGILGGGSLAIASNAPQPGRAADFVRFMTSDPAQKILASYAIPATRIAPYGDERLLAVIPHLKELRAAVEDARPRPINIRYPEFSATIVRWFKANLKGAALSTEFIDDMKIGLGIN